MAMTLNGYEISWNGLDQATSDVRTWAGRVLGGDDTTQVIGTDTGNSGLVDTSGGDGWLDSVSGYISDMQKWLADTIKEDADNVAQVQDNAKNYMPFALVAGGALVTWLIVRRK